MSWLLSMHLKERGPVMETGHVRYLGAISDRRFFCRRSSCPADKHLWYGQRQFRKNKGNDHLLKSWRAKDSVGWEPDISGPSGVIGISDRFTRTRILDCRRNSGLGRSAFRQTLLLCAVTSRSRRLETCEESTADSDESRSFLDCCQEITTHSHGQLRQLQA